MRRGGTRTRLGHVAVVACVLLGGASWSSAAGAALASGDQPSGDQPTGQPAFVPGAAYATADSIGFQLVYGGSPIGFTVGRSIAKYRNTTGSSEARALDLGAFPQLFGPLPTCAKQPILSPSAVPPITAANSFDADSAQSQRTEAFFPGLSGAPSVVSAGFQDATATAAPSSRATTESPSQNAGIFTLTGARTEATAQLVNGTRTAHAQMTADSLDVLNGLIVFSHPKWEAVASTGGAESLAGRFSYESANVRGRLRLPAQAGVDLAWLSGSLASSFFGLGVHLDLPRVVIEGKRVRVTPLALRLTDPPLGAQAIKPLLAQLLPNRQDTFDQLFAQDCSNATPLQLIDVVFQVLSGAGSIIMPVGGVEASTDDTYYPPADVLAESATAPDLGVAPAPLATAPPLTARPSNPPLRAPLRAPVTPAPMPAADDIAVEVESARASAPVGVDSSHRRAGRHVGRGADPVAPRRTVGRGRPT